MNWSQIRDSAAAPPDFIGSFLFSCPKAVKLITWGQLAHLSPNYLLTDRLSGRSIDRRRRSALNGFVSQAVLDWWMLLQRVKLWQRAAGIVCWPDVSNHSLIEQFLGKICQSCQIRPGMSGQILTWRPPSFAAIYFTTWKMIFFFFPPDRRCTTPSRARSCSGHCKSSYMDSFYFCCAIKQRKETEQGTGTTAC